jgi:hypothetical protein
MSAKKASRKTAAKKKAAERTTAAHGGARERAKAVTILNELQTETRELSEKVGRLLQRFS